MYQMYTDMVKASLKGVEKVVYLPSNPDGGNPLNFWAFQQGSIPGMNPGNAPNSVNNTFKRN